ncbi:hypothetical protein BCR39DRAFT_158930 [Naematelia encephala]|uniref:Uncharacterized protein n=1 Tax=Naematelia encephala TaxID=71784 RepID=A0A1Y2B7D4_9TREE|nr:hypothetical protein BCR39DRAFT_158930 [Naematelia encephala]
MRSPSPVVSDPQPVPTRIALSPDSSPELESTTRSTWVTRTPPRIAQQPVEYDELGTDSDSKSDDQEAVDLGSTSSGLLDSIESFRPANDNPTESFSKRKQGASPEATEVDWTRTPFARFIRRDESLRTKMQIVSPESIERDWTGNAFARFIREAKDATKSPNATHKLSQYSENISRDSGQASTPVQPARLQIASKSDVPTTPIRSKSAKLPCTPPMTSSTEVSFILDPTAQHSIPTTPTQHSTPSRSLMTLKAPMTPDSTHQSILTTIHTLVDLIASPSPARLPILTDEYNHDVPQRICKGEKDLNEKYEKYGTTDMADLAEQVARKVRTGNGADMNDAKYMVLALSKLLNEQ